MSISEQLLVFSDNFLAPTLIVLFSYLIWVQSYQYDISEYEEVIRERYENEEFPWGDEPLIKTVHVRTQELGTSRYRFERIFNPFRDIEGHTTINFFVLKNLNLTPTEIEDVADFEHATVIQHESIEYTIMMHAVEPDEVSSIMDTLFKTIYDNMDA